MRLVDSISIVVAKLLNDLLDPVKVFACGKIPYDALKAAVLSAPIFEETLTKLTPKLQPFSYRKACRSRRVGCSDPFWVSTVFQEHDISMAGSLVKSSRKVCPDHGLPAENGQNQGRREKEGHVRL